MLITIQYELEAQYQEKSMLTDLFTENKFWGWAGLFFIFFTACGILIFQMKIWEEEEAEMRNEIEKRKINKMRISSFNSFKSKEDKN